MTTLRPLPRLVRLMTLTTIIITIIFPFRPANTTTSYDYTSTTFTIQTFASAIIRFKHAEAIDHIIVRSTADCARICSQDPECYAFLVVAQNGADSLAEDVTLYNCTSLFPLTYNSYFSVVGGLTGVHKDSSITVGQFKQPPAIYRGVLTGIRTTTFGISAIYDLSSAQPKVSTLGLLYEDPIQDWPYISPACMAQLALITGLSGTYLKVTNTKADEIRAEVYCQEFDDEHHSDAVCHAPTGIWTYTGGYLNVGCLSSTCYRYDGTSRARYSGTVSETLNGVGCQRWDSHEPENHIMVDTDFVVDNKNATEAQNYCRDPDGEGFPWCYQLYGKRWEACDVSICGV